MKIDKLIIKANEIWGDEKLSEDEIAVRLGVVYGDICRYIRDKSDNKAVNEHKFKKELGNVIFSTIKWADQLGYSVEECLNLAIKAQTNFAKTRRSQNK